MRRSPWRRAAATLAAALSTVLLVSACAADAAPPAPGVIRVGIAEPGQPIIPAHADDPLVARILPAVTAGLVVITPEGAVEDDLAASIDTDDNLVFTVTVVGDAQFSDGEPLTAASFVEAWRLAALPDSGHPDRAAFEPIRGWIEEADLLAGDEGEAEAEPVSGGDLVAAGGLELLDELSFRITLNAPRPEFPSELGREAFLPLPSAAIDDPVAYAAGAVGAGPYRLATAEAWHPGDRLELEPNPGYRGSRTPANGGISFRFFADPQVAVAELLAGGLDVVDGLASGQAESLRGRFGSRLLERPLPAEYLLVAPAAHPQFGGEEGRLRRAALAAVLDRDRMSRERLDADATPARDFLPVGFLAPEHQLAEEERLDVPWLDGANDFFAQGRWRDAEEFGAWEGSLAIAVVRNTPEEAIAEGIAGRWTTALGVPTVVLRFGSEAEIVDELAEDGVPAFVVRRIDFPTPSVSAALDALVPSSERPSVMVEQLDAATQAIEAGEAVRLALLAQEPLATALPVIPLVSPTTSAVIRDGVRNAELDWSGVLEYARVQSSP